MSGLILVAYIENENKFVGSGTILIEPKLSHTGKNAGHLEDIVIDPSYRNKGIGKNIINYLIRYAETHNCYKTILNCDEDKIKYYEKF
jgi:glucosamine-phosphate N-acetyltransferase